MKLLTEDIEKEIGKRLNSFNKIYRQNKTSSIKLISWILLPTALLILLLPWTQNIRTKGDITTKYQQDRPQQINSIIPGKIAKWYIKEGDYVKKGDTIAQLAEIKDDYLDPLFLTKTQAQLTAEKNYILSYHQKIESYYLQINALENEKMLKIKSIDNKIQQTIRKINSDSLKMMAANNELTIYERQLSAANKMHSQGVIALTELEKRKANLQNTNAKFIGATNDYNNTKQELVIIQLDKSAIVQTYLEKIAKAKSEIFQSESQIAAAQGKLAKLENQFANYSIRAGQYYILSPQDGQIIKAKKGGIHEIIKDGEMIVEVVPTQSQKAAEIWVDPMDLQLLEVGQEIRLQFDGFPAIVFSGWPNQSYGTFVGEILMIETNVGDNNKFRVLVTENKKAKAWPTELKLGGGVKAFAMLKNVPIWYELWRQINGFPPDFYKKNDPSTILKNK
ncbi:MAG: hypothetical protein RIQ33_1855 [Bacteroidota bacterium]|jgi:multidrug efflux pump subunit AcrA (membrane-fusion protein)